MLLADDARHKQLHAHMQVLNCKALSVLSDGQMPREASSDKLRQAQERIVTLMKSPELPEPKTSSWVTSCCGLQRPSNRPDHGPLQRIRAGAPWMAVRNCGFYFICHLAIERQHALKICLQSHM